MKIEDMLSWKRLRDRVIVETRKGYDLDLESSVVLYDEVGSPKRFIPTRWNDSCGWMYITNPIKTPLQGKDLVAHLELVGSLKRTQQ